MAFVDIKVRGEFSHALSKTEHWLRDLVRKNTDQRLNNISAHAEKSKQTKLFWNI